MDGCPTRSVTAGAPQSPCIAPAHFLQTDGGGGASVPASRSSFPSLPSVESEDPAVIIAANDEATALDADHLAGQHRRAALAQERADLIALYDSLLARGLTPKAACRELKRAGHPILPLKIWRWKKHLQKTGSLLPLPSKAGAKPSYMPSPDELALVRAIWTAMDHTDRGGSAIAAYRIVARSANPIVTECFRRVVLRRNTKSIPPSWRSLLETPQSVVQFARDPKTLQLNYIHTPKSRSFVGHDGIERPLQVGTIFESDDGTVNFPVWMPWPFGGDKCSENFGVRCGRFQLLPVVDFHSGFCPLFHFVLRPKSSYRAEDVVALFGDLFLHIGRPEVFRLERGSWESDHVKSAAARARVPVCHAWLSKNKPAVEGFFNRLWTPLSLVPGHVGRDRGRYAQVTDLLLACQDGRRDPRDHFLNLDQAILAIAGAVAWVNSEPIESRDWGRWIPQQRWEQGRAPVEARKLLPEMAPFFSRERADWTVRGHIVGGTVTGPMMTFPIYFEDAALWEFEGCKTRCYFDPYQDPCLGTIELNDTWRGYKPGHIIAANVPALEKPPQIILAADAWSGQDKYQRSLDIRKQVAKYVRAEAWNWLGGRTSTTRDGAAPLLQCSGVSAERRISTSTPIKQLARSNMAEAFE